MMMHAKRSGVYRKSKRNESVTQQLTMRRFHIGHLRKLVLKAKEGYVVLKRQDHVPLFRSVTRDACYGRLFGCYEKEKRK